jgi:hypothetical protein
MHCLGQRWPKRIVPAAKKKPRIGLPGLKAGTTALRDALERLGGLKTLTTDVLRWCEKNGNLR